MLTALAGRGQLNALAARRRRVDGYHEDAVTLFEAWSSVDGYNPDTARKKLVSDAIGALDEAGIWAKIDRLLCVAEQEQASLRFWNDPNLEATAVSTPTFTADRGYKGNGSSSYINTGFVPSTHGVSYTQNDALIGVYSRTSGSTTGAVDIGARNSGSSRQSILQIRSGAGDHDYRVNINTATSTLSLTATHGLFLCQRSGASATSLWGPNGLLHSDTTASAAPPEYAMYIGALNTGGTAGVFSPREYSLAIIGASLSEQEHADLQTILVDGYLDSIGAKV